MEKTEITGISCKNSGCIKLKMPTKPILQKQQLIDLVMSKNRSNGLLQKQSFHCSATSKICSPILQS